MITINFQMGQKRRLLHVLILAFDIKITFWHVCGNFILARNFILTNSSMFLFPLFTKDIFLLLPFYKVTGLPKNNKVI